MNYSSSRTGFTLIEVLTVVAVIAIMATTAAVQLRQGFSSMDGEVNASKQGFDSSLALARNYLLTGHICCNVPNPPHGYGVLIPLDSTGDNNTYQLYADFNGDNKYDTGGLDVILSTGSLHEQVRFVECGTSTIIVTPTFGNYCDINFTNNYDPMGDSPALHLANNVTPDTFIDTYIYVILEHIQNPSVTIQTTIYAETFLIE